ncbi:MAG: ECF transporter S component [Lachnospiraceae bacterium]|nr:ECF transporter S component [Lachnospiraceae bacterium]
MSNENVTNNENAKKPAISPRLMAGVGMLTAAAIVLQYLEFPLPFLIPPFIKMDFSDLPALIGAFAYGPLAGVLIELIKNLIHCLASQSFTVGELSNFILGAVFTFTAGAIYKSKKSRKNAIIGGVIGALVMGIISFPSNLFIVYPFYYNFMPEEAVLGAYRLIIPGMKSVTQSLIVFNIPFTVIKGLLSVLISMLIYKPLSKILKG